MRIAVVGSGGAGLAAAWALSRDHDVVVYEARARAGGHARTVQVPGDGPRSGPVGVDTGFIVYNTRTYPHFTRFLDLLGASSDVSCMSFAVSLSGGRIEYAGRTRGLLAQPRAVLSPSHWRMTADMLRFYRAGPRLVYDGDGEDMTVAEALEAGGYSSEFAERHLLPLAAAIWSCGPGQILDMPARTLVRFMENHGLLAFRGRPRWRTVRGGSACYVDRVMTAFAGRVRFSAPVVAIRPTQTGLEVRDGGGHSDRFDRAVLAVHADQALQLLGRKASRAERSLLGAFRYTNNRAVLHRDCRYMPRRRSLWSSWNYLGTMNGESGSQATVTYWMNNLQRLDTREQIFVSLNPALGSDPAHAIDVTRFRHPIFDGAAVAAQARLPEIQGRRHIWFCGSYWGYGFHEDAVESGFAVAEALGAPVPWSDRVPWVSPAAAAGRSNPAMVEAAP